MVAKSIKKKSVKPIKKQPNPSVILKKVASVSDSNKALQKEIKGYPSVFGFFNQQHMAMRNDFNFFDSRKDWYPSTVWGINISIPIYNSGEGKSKTNQKRLALIQSENELKQIESQIFNLYEMLKSNYNSAYLNYKNQKSKLVLIKGVYKRSDLEKLIHF